MRLSRSTLVVVFLLGLASSGLGLGVRAVGTTLYVNEVAVLSLRSHAGGSPVRRCAQLAAKLAPIGAGAPVSVRRAGRAYRIAIGGAVIAVKRAEAKAQGISPAGLAGAWAGRLRQALALPPIRLSRQAADLPVGGKVRIALVGSEAMNAKIDLSAAGIVNVERSVGAVTVTARTLGKATLLVVGASHSGSVELRVLPWAARLPQNLTVSVTGSPTTSEIVRGAIERAIRTQLATVRDAWVSADIPIAGQLDPEHRRTYLVPVRVGSAEGLPVAGHARVTVRNLGLGTRSESELLYCNDPETVRRVGLLFAAKLEREKPARLLFHHINMSGEPLTIEVRVFNEREQPARLLVIPGEGDPDRNPVLVGAVAGDRFLRNWLLGSGEVLWLPAKTWVPLSIRRLAPLQTTSGLLSLRLLSDGPSELIVRADARTPSFADSDRPTAAPWRLSKARPLALSELRTPPMNDHVYPNPFQAETVEYRVGGKHGFIFVGRKAIERADLKGKLDGNFGVVYTIKANIENPTAVPANVEVVFEASAGYSGGLFVVDGKQLRSPLLQPKDEFRLWRGRLEPGEHKVCRILTIPLSGSSYPATITVRSTDALASGSVR